MAKSKKCNLKRLIIALVVFVMGILMFVSIFIPMFKVKEAEMNDRFAAKDVISVLKYDSLLDAMQEGDELSEEETVALFLTLSDDMGSKIKATAILDLVVAIFGALIAVLAILSLVFKLNVIKMLLIAFGTVGFLSAIGCIVSAFVFLGTEVAGEKVGDYYAISFAPFMALIPSALAAVCTWIKK